MKQSGTHLILIYILLTVLLTAGKPSNSHHIRIVIQTINTVSVNIIELSDTSQTHISIRWIATDRNQKQVTIHEIEKTEKLSNHFIHNVNESSLYLPKQPEGSLHHFIHHQFGSNQKILVYTISET